MKKLIMLLIVTLGSFTAKAQKSKIGFTLGYSELRINEKNDVEKYHKTYRGFFFGINREFNTSNKKIQVSPSILFAQHIINGRDKKLKSFQIPILLKFQLNENINLQAGPLLNYILEGSQTFSKGITFGAGYRLSYNSSIYINYNILPIISSDEEYNYEQTIRMNHLNIGFTYRP